MLHHVRASLKSLKGIYIIFHVSGFVSSFQSAPAPFLRFPANVWHVWPFKLSGSTSWARQRLFRSRSMTTTNQVCLWWIFLVQLFKESQSRKKCRAHHDLWSGFFHVSGCMSCYDLFKAAVITVLCVFLVQPLRPPASTTLARAVH